MQTPEAFFLKAEGLCFLFYHVLTYTNKGIIIVMKTKTPFRQGAGAILRRF
jgi:hypothetical protein